MPRVEKDLATILQAVRQTAWVDGFWYGIAIGALIGGILVMWIK